MPCTEKRVEGSYFCAFHTKACREIMVGIFNEFPEHDKMSYVEAEKLD